MFIREKFINVLCYIYCISTQRLEGGGGRVVIIVSIVNKVCFVLF